MNIYKVEVHGIEAETLYCTKDILITVGKDKFDAAYGIYQCVNDFYEVIYSIDAELLESIDGYNISIREISKDEYKDNIMKEINNKFDVNNEVDNKLSLYKVFVEYEYFHDEKETLEIIVATSKQEAMLKVVEKLKEYNEEYIITRTAVVDKITSRGKYKIDII